MLFPVSFHVLANHMGNTGLRILADSFSIYTTVLRKGVNSIYLRPTRHCEHLKGARQSHTPQEIASASSLVLLGTSLAMTDGRAQ